MSEVADNQQNLEATNNQTSKLFLKVDFISYGEGTFIIILVGVFTIFLAVLFNILQKKKGRQNHGISGPFWYAAGATIQILLFAIVSVKLKMHAAGAKTFLQVIRCRFGYRTHKVYVAYALLTNLMVTGMLMLGGSEVLRSMVDGYTIEMATLMCAMVIGGYTQIGGLGATFYASYFNTVMIFVGILTFSWKIFFSGSTSEDFPLGSLANVFDLVSKAKGPETNYEASYLTMISQGGLVFGIINIVGNFGTVFVDQSYWQSSIAAKPKQGVYGFLAGGLVWFAVPFTFATSMGLAYIAMGTHEGHPLLSDNDVSSGLLPVAVANRCGNHMYLLILMGMILMAVTSTGSAEVVAVASILVYDIHMVYMKPFRTVTSWKTCELCGANKQLGKGLTQCKCTSMSSCHMCKADDEHRRLIKRGMEPMYSCPCHGQYRLYRDFMKHRKTFYMFISAISIVPVSMILQAFGFTMGWVYLFMGVLIGSAVIPVILAVTWKRVTAQGMTYGPIFGTCSAVIIWLTVSCSYPGGLWDFMKNTGQELSMLTGNLVSIILGGLMTVIISRFTVSQLPSEDVAETWDKTMDIDNPLYPWTDLYRSELNIKRSSGFNRPSLSAVQAAFRHPYIVALAASTVLTLILIVIWPAATASLGVFDQSTFYIWILISFVWAVLAAVYITTMPLWSEVKAKIAKLRNISHVSDGRVSDHVSLF